MRAGRQSFLHGAAILAASLVIVKVLGLVFKIPLTNLLGGVGMGYYNTAFMLYSPVFALAVGGLPAAVSKMVAQLSARGAYRDVRRLFSVSMAVYFVTGLAGAGVMAAGARLFVDAVKNPSAFYSVLALAPSIFFGCVMAGFRGYFEGLRDMRPTAVSQIVEMVVKLAAGLGLAAWVMSAAEVQFEQGGVVFGAVVSDAARAGAAALPYAAAASVAGVSISDLAGALCLAVRCRRSDGIAPALREASPPPAPAGQLLRELFALSLPIAVGGVVINLTSFADFFSMMDRLNFLAREQSAALLEACAGTVPEGMALNDLPNYLYGCCTGLAVSVYSIIPALAGVFAKSALPNVAASWARGERDATVRKIVLVLRVTALTTVPAGIGVSVLSGPILSLLFSARGLEARAAAPVLAIMGIGVIFQASALLLTSILQALGDTKAPVLAFTAGGIVKVILNMALMSYPAWNIKGAAFSTVVCGLLTFALEFAALCRRTGARIRLSAVFFRPFLAGALSGAGAKLAFELAQRFLGKGVSLLIAVGIAAVVCLISVFCLKAVEKNDVLLAPGGKKAVKVLEKMGLMR